MLAIYLSMLETQEDQRQFLKLYQAYEKKVYAVTLNLLGDTTRAEDAAQQAWTHLLQRWDKVSALDWDGACGYAVTAAKNAALDQLRRERRLASLPEDWDPPGREENQDGYHYLVSLIRALPESYRRTLELKCVAEWSNQEIAAHLGVSESTVASRVLRGRAMLRETLEREGYRCG